MGRPYNNPVNSLSYTENFLYMLGSFLSFIVIVIHYFSDHLQELNYKPNPQLARALDVLFILHADHELHFPFSSSIKCGSLTRSCNRLNCSTAAMRHIASSLTDPYIAVAGTLPFLSSSWHPFPR